MKPKMTREEKVLFAQEEILTTEETCRVLGRTRQQLNNFMRKQIIAPVKVTTNGNLFLKDDVAVLKTNISQYSAEYKAGYKAALKENGIIPGDNVTIGTSATLEEFVNDMVSSPGTCTNENFGFVLKRYSKQSPYWTVFACKLDENDEAVACGGHYCLASNVKLDEVLNTLVAIGWSIKIESGFFLDWEN